LAQAVSPSGVRGLAARNDSASCEEVFCERRADLLWGRH